MRSARKPQLDLRLAAVKPDAALRWHEGASVLWLGQSLQLAFCGTQTQTCREANILRLLLPQDVSPRQIQDCAEAWLRSEAMCYLTQCLHDRMEEKKSALVTRRHSTLRQLVFKIFCFAQALSIVKTARPFSPLCCQRLNQRLPLAHGLKQTHGSGSRDIQRFSLLRHGDSDAILSGTHQG